MQVSCARFESPVCDELRLTLREMELDAEEGADILMVKPGMPYLDVLADARARFDLPLAVYQVSGEYSMIEAAAQKGWIDRTRARDESQSSSPRKQICYNPAPWRKWKGSGRVATDAPRKRGG